MSGTRTYLKNYFWHCYNRKIRQHGAAPVKPGETILNSANPKTIIRQWPGKYLIQVGGHVFSLRRFLTETPEFTIGEKGKPETRKGLYYNEWVTMSRGQFGRFKDLNADNSFPEKAFSLINLGNGKILIKQHGKAPVSIQMEKVDKPRIDSEDPVEANAAKLAGIIRSSIESYTNSRPGVNIEDSKEPLFSLQVSFSEKAEVLLQETKPLPFVLSFSVINNKAIRSFSVLNGKNSPPKEIVKIADQSIHYYNQTLSGHYVYVSPNMPEWFYYRINKG